jgi:hypothetical protein
MDIGSRSLAGSYDSYYFAHGCGRPYHRDDSWLDFFDSIAERIVAGINPATALDCGCALGFLVEALRRRGVAADGIDVSEFAIQNVHPDIAQHCRLGSATDPFGQRYDLIICIEVLEHLPSTDADRAVRNFTQFTNDVLLCSTPFDYSEATHVNVQPPDYWAELLARYGFIRDVDFDASFIAPWAVRFRRSSEPLPRIVQAYERRDWLLWKENQDLRKLAIGGRDRSSSDDRDKQAQAVLLAEKDRAIQALNDHIAQIQNSRVLRLMQPLYRLRSRLFPKNDRRRAK